MTVAVVQQGQLVFQGAAQIWFSEGGGAAIEQLCRLDGQLTLRWWIILLSIWSGQCALLSYQHPGMT